MKNRKGKRIKYLTAALAVTLTAGMLSGCGQKAEEKMSTAIHVDTQTAEKGTLEIYGNYIGTVTPNDSVDVTPMVSGTVTKVNVQVGDTVKEGDVLCQFDDTAAQFSVDSAQNAVNSARAGKEAAGEQKNMAAEQSKSSIQTLEDTLDSYEKSLKTAKKQLKKLQAAQGDVDTASQQAKTAFTTAKKAYKTAQILYINYQAFLSANPDCQTTAGLTAAMTPLPGADGSIEAGAAEKAKKAAALMNSLNRSGLTVEYLSDTGLNSLKENANDAEAAYNKVAGSYGETESGITTLKNSIATLKTQIKATKSSLQAAKKSQKMAAGSSDAVYDAQINAAETGVDSAQYQKGLYTVKAPVAGVIEASNVTENEIYAAAGMPAFTISGKETMLVTFYVPEEVKNFLKPGDAVKVENGEKTYKGHISLVGTAVEPQKGLFKVEAQIYMGKENTLSTGTSVSLSVVTERVDNQILVPYDAVYYENNQPYVYCVKEGEALRVDVTTGTYDEETMVIEHGIEPGDEVITSWASGLKNGAKIAEPKNKTAETGDSAAGIETAGSQKEQSGTAGNQERE